MSKNYFTAPDHTSQPENINAKHVCYLWLMIGLSTITNKMNGLWSLINWMLHHTSMAGNVNKTLGQEEYWKEDDLVSLFIWSFPFLLLHDRKDMDSFPTISKSRDLKVILFFVSSTWSCFHVEFIDCADAYHANDRQHCSSFFCCRQNKQSRGWVYFYRWCFASTTLSQKPHLML